MKIAHIAPCWGRTPPTMYGGTEAIVSLLTEQLVHLGNDVTLCATGDSITSGKLWSWFMSPTSGYQFTDEIVHAVKAYNFITENNFDIVHNHTYYVGEALLSLSSVPSLTTFHGAYYSQGVDFHKAFSSTHSYVSISRQQQRLMPQLNWVGNVYNALKVEEFPFEKEKDDYLLFVGNITPWKGPHVAVQVAKLLGRRLKIAGPIQQIQSNAPRDAQSYYEEEIALYVDGTSIEYVGEVNFAQKIELYRYATALLVPIDWEEPFGLVMIEALACGTPVVAYARGAAPEIIDQGCVGFVVHNVDEMVEAVKNIKQISAWACREHVQQHFDAKVMTEQYISIYQRIIDQKKY